MISCTLSPDNMYKSAIAGAELVVPPGK